MERESFEDTHLAQMLNDSFISIKVDKEERPDIDSIYMRVCQAYTGNGGWPTSIFMSADQKPFYAGTYFPPEHFSRLLENITFNWHSKRDALTKSSDEVIRHINTKPKTHKDHALTHSAFTLFSRTFDAEYGGFGGAPKFPSPHNLMYLMGYAEAFGEKHALEITEKTLLQMYKGGIFDHIGYGFSRYSTDRYWLAPHFEKMLYDNALLAVTYLTAFEQTGNELYKSVAEKIIVYVERELSNGYGGLFSAQDADSDGIEGKYYTFTPYEVSHVLGEWEGAQFNNHFDITAKGNFEGENIPNLIKQSELYDIPNQHLTKLYEYRLSRMQLHRDEKVLMSWNSLMLWTYATAIRVLHDVNYTRTAVQMFDFIENNLCDSDTVYVGITDGKVSGKGFLDDYAFYILALIGLYEAVFDDKYLNRALDLTKKVINDFYDSENKGFYFYANDSERLIIRPKESYDGAIPSGNSVMAYNLDRLAKLTKDENLFAKAREQREFMEREAGEYPAGFSFFLVSTLPTKDVFCVLKDKNDISEIKVKSNWVVRIVDSPDYPLVNGKTTFYVCEGDRCLPPSNEL